MLQGPAKTAALQILATKMKKAGKVKKSESKKKKRVPSAGWGTSLKGGGIMGLGVSCSEGCTGADTA